MIRKGDKLYCKCVVCDQDFRFGPGVYDGRVVKSWQGAICDICDRSNYDGVVPSTHPNLMEHLRSIGIEPELNASGWIPIPPRGF